MKLRMKNHTWHNGVQEQEEGACDHREGNQCVWTDKDVWGEEKKKATVKTLWRTKKQHTLRKHKRREK